MRKRRHQEDDAEDSRQRRRVEEEDESLSRAHAMLRHPLGDHFTYLRILTLFEEQKRNSGIACDCLFFVFFFLSCVTFWFRIAAAMV